MVDLFPGYVAYHIAYQTASALLIQTIDITDGFIPRLGIAIS